MNGPSPIDRPPPPTPAEQHARLRRAAHDLEAVFLGHLMQAMRATVPQDGEPDPGRELFTAMLDDTIAREAAHRMERGLGEALYRQLSRRLPPPTEGMSDGGGGP